MFYDFFTIFFRAVNINLIEKHFNSLQFVDLINFIEKSLRYGIIKIQLNVERLRIAKSEARSNNLWVFCRTRVISGSNKIENIRITICMWKMSADDDLRAFILLFMREGLFISCSRIISLM